MLAGDAAPPLSPAPTEASGMPGPVAAMPQSTPVAVTRPASVVAFVSGMLFFVPVVPQAVSICAGVYAVGRRRQPNERVVLAWAGILVSIAALGGWMMTMGVLWRAFRIAGMTTRGTPTWFYPPPQSDSEPEQTATLADQMRRIHRAAEAYHRDFRKWPESIDILAGHSLPRGFTMSPRLTYRQVPADVRDSREWILIVSDEVRDTVDGQPLKTPHCLILRLSGKVELLPATEVSKLLPARQTEEPP